jgi:magnesium-transporting ATPase (P-type)
MERPPRPRAEGVILPAMLFRAWVFLGLLEAALVMAGFFLVLLRDGWSLGADVSVGAPLHGAYLEATTMTFAGIVACQIGTALAARTERAALLTIGLFSNPLLIWGIVSEVAFAAAIVYAPPLQSVFGTRALGPADVGLLVPFPFLVWGADELRRAVLRRRRRSPRERCAGPARGPLEPRLRQ